MLTLKELRAAKPGVFRSITGVSPKEFEALLAQVKIEHADFHGEWNYTILPTDQLD